MNCIGCEYISDCGVSGYCLKLANAVVTSIEPACANDLIEMVKKKAKERTEKDNVK